MGRSKKLRIHFHKGPKYRKMRYISASVYGISVPRAVGTGMFSIEVLGTFGVEFHGKAVVGRAAFGESFGVLCLDPLGNTLAKTCRQFALAFQN